jgi:hypothetical protein
MNWKKVFQVMHSVEKQIVGELKGKERKALVIDVLVKIVRLPFPLSLFERQIWGLLLTGFVYLLNSVFGHDWVEKFNPDEIPNETL